MRSGWLFELNNHAQLKRWAITVPTHYDVLGVEPDADDETIHLAFRMLAKCWHPDSNSRDDWSEKQFKHITAAYVALRNPIARAAYDKRLVAERHRRGRRRTHELIYWVIAVTVTFSLVSGGVCYFRLQPAATVADAVPLPNQQWSRAPREETPGHIDAATPGKPAYRDHTLQPTTTRPDVQAPRAAAQASSPSPDRMEAMAGPAVMTTKSATQVTGRAAGRAEPVMSVDTTTLPLGYDGSYPHPRDVCLQMGTCLGRASDPR
jgi:hypothetical protein